MAKSKAEKLVDSHPKKKSSEILRLPSGSFSLNLAMSGHWDWAVESRRMMEIYGPSASGKSTLSQEMGKAFLKEYRDAGYKGIKINICDAEFKLDEPYLQRIIPSKDYILKRENICEEIWWWIEDQLKKGEKIFIIDSIGAMTSYEMRKRGMEKIGFANVSREMSWGIKNYLPDIYKANATIMFINHVRFKIGAGYGDPETTPGGEKPKEASSYRLKIWTTRISKEEQAPGTLNDLGEEINENLNTKVETGIGVKIKIVKNDTFSPYRVCEIPIRYGVGIDKKRDYFNFLEKIGFVSKPKKATSYSIKGFKDKRSKNKIIHELSKNDSKIKSASVEYTRKYGHEILEK